MKTISTGLFKGRNFLSGSFILMFFFVQAILFSNAAMSQSANDSVAAGNITYPTKADTVVKPATSVGKINFRRNNVKINLSSLLLNNYSLYYERSLSRKISFQAGYRFQPTSTMWKNKLTRQLINKVTDVDKETERTINSFTTSNKTYTGEFRFYGGKHAGAKGMYLGVYGRYANFTMNYDNYNFETDEGKSTNIPLKGKVHGLGAGLVVGAQWWFGKRVCMDLYLMGGHYGSLKGNITGAADLTGLSANEKEQLKNDIEDKFAINNKRLLKATVKNDGITGEVNGPYVGIRAAGLSVGIVF